MVLFNVGYNRHLKEPFILTIEGMEYNVETHEDAATFTLSELDRFLKAIVDARNHYMQHLH